jgi:hypothetical protein
LLPCSRLYGEKDVQHFKLEWVPILYQITKEGSIFNWDQILSANIQQAINKTLESPLRYCVGFLMSSYLVDVVCAKKYFSINEIELVTYPTTYSLLLLYTLESQVQEIFLQYV